MERSLSKYFNNIEIEYVNPDFYYNNIQYSENCHALMVNYKISLLSIYNCIIKYSQPIHYCQKCIDTYILYNESYEKLLNSDKHINLTRLNTNNTFLYNCPQEILENDVVQPLLKSYTFINDLWTSAYCSDCFVFYNDNQTGISINYAITNFTQNFYQYYQNFLDCEVDYTAINKINETNFSICNYCRESYSLLNTFYITRGDDNSKNTAVPKDVCIDIMDLMNKTYEKWKNKYGCSNFAIVNIPLITIQAFILALPIFFYVGAFIHTSRKEKIFVIPRRFSDYFTSSSVPEVEDIQTEWDKENIIIYN
ncbi:unnamed protein product [Gordionus sp. m RMFG-2023]